MADGIGLEKSGLAFVPVKTDPYRNLAFKERPLLGGGYALDAKPLFLLFELPVDGCRADRLKQCPKLIDKAKLKSQKTYRAFDKGRKELPAGVVEKLPNGGERFDKGFMVLFRLPCFFAPRAFIAAFNRRFGYIFDRFPA